MNDQRDFPNLTRRREFYFRKCS